VNSYETMDLIIDKEILILNHASIYSTFNISICVGTRNLNIDIFILLLICENEVWFMRV
jgi:hypothetical protein